MAEAVARRRRRRGSRWVLLVVSLGSTLLLLAGVEGLLRWSGVGDIPPAEASRLRYQQVYPPMLQPGSRPDGSAALITNDRRMAWQSVLAQKPEGGLRIFTVGGSATAGLGYSANMTFSRQLERLLREAEPDREIELVNLGIVALSSSQVRWIVEDVCQNFDPDLVIVYSGNNEFLEIHAEKFVELSGGRDTSVLSRLSDTNVFRLVNQLVRGRPKGRNTTIHDMAQANERVSESEIVDKVELSTAEYDELVDVYEQNIEAMVNSAQGTGTPLLLMTVASNWEWRGQDDLPDGWIAELLGDEAGLSSGGAAEASSSATLEAALARVDLELAAAGPRQRSGWQFKRAELLAALGRDGEAVVAYRQSMNSDPHLRRATDDLAERVRAVAARHDVPLFDTIELLSGLSPRGMVGFEFFYDYVHFSPRGALVVAGALYDSLAALGLCPGGTDAGLWVDREWNDIAQLTSDPLAIDRWMGLGFDLGRLDDRDLWKHQIATAELDQALADDPGDVAALIWRANVDFFTLGGFNAAVRGYEAALALDPANGAAKDNLALLRGRRRP